MRKTTSSIMPIIMTRGIITSKSEAYGAAVDVCNEEDEVPPEKSLKRLVIPKYPSTPKTIVWTILLMSIVISGIASAVSLILRGAGK